jgi:folate-binding protein YgfZ
MTDSSLSPYSDHDTPQGVVACPASELGLLTIEGEDAPGFLHGQLSSDVSGLAEGRSQWSSYNSPKGRTLATLRLWRYPGTGGPPRFGVLLAADLAAPIAKRLGMFVLRSKVRISDDTGKFALIGIGGPRAAEAAAELLGATPQRDGAAEMEGGAAIAVGLGDGRIVVAADVLRDAVIQQTLADRAAAAGNDVWRALAIRAGVPLVTAATSERFVPQMLNLDALGAISFDKGCYPGQEIVARTRFLTQLKERLFALSVNAPEPPAGSRIFSPAFGDQPCGTVINAAPDGDAGSAILAVVQIAAVEHGTLSLDTPTGSRLSRRELPYALPAPEPSRARVRL